MRRQRRVAPLFGLMLVASALLLSACSDADDGAGTDDSTPTTTAAAQATTTTLAPVTITFQAEGTGTANVVYFDDEGLVQEDVTLPWAIDVVYADGYPTYSLTVTSFTGPPTCRVLQDGQVVVEEVGGSQIAQIATCSGDTP
ncbi:hypothetical protein B7486_60415 [cyanobacterium TDX16]|nr:hypothetical protein B7486_60415 [cyanobacterium TDX16]